MAYTISPCSIDATAVGSETLYGSWVACAIPIGSYMPAIDVGTCSFSGLTMPLISFGLQFGSSTSVVLATVEVGTANGVFAGSGIFAKDVAFLTAVAKVRMYYSSSGGGRLVGSITGGEMLTVAESTPDGTITADDGADLPRLRIVSGGEDRRVIAKLRYKFAQTDAAAGAWTGTPVGTKVYRLPGPGS